MPGAKLAFLHTFPSKVSQQHGQGGAIFNLHLLDEKTEPQKGLGTCPRSHGRENVKARLKAGLVRPKAEVTATPTREHSTCPVCCREALA